MVISILNSVFPTRCPFCDKVGCKKCENDIESKNFVRVFENKNFKLVCLSSFIYEGKVRGAVLRYKFSDRKDYAKKFAKSMVKTLNQNFSLPNFDFITNVPLDRKNLSQRGYDQAFELAKEISHLTKIPYKKILKKKATNVSQHNLNLVNRKCNSKDVYYPFNSVILKGERILLCDDVITTGSTVVSCASVLKKARASSVCAITLACTI